MDPSGSTVTTKDHPGYALTRGSLETPGEATICFLSPTSYTLLSDALRTDVQGAFGVGTLNWIGRQGPRSPGTR